MGYVALTTHSRPSNYSVGHKRPERVPSNSANHHSRALSIESRRQRSMTASRRCFLSNSSIILDIQNHGTIFTVLEKAGLTPTVSISTRRSQLQLLNFQLLTKHPIAPPTTNAVSPAH